MRFKVNSYVSKQKLNPGQSFDARVTRASHDDTFNSEFSEIVALEGVTKPYILNRLKCCDKQINTDSFMILKDNVETVNNCKH